MSKYDIIFDGSAVIALSGDRGSEDLTMRNTTDVTGDKPIAV
jgi:hypothetical protein